MSLNKMVPFFSIICATYNRADLLPRAIDSVISQDFKDWELLIVDDGSTDKTEQIAGQYLDDERIRYIQLESNKGVGVARNKGVMSSSAYWVVLLDSDNALVPGALAMMHSLVATFPDVLMHKFLVRSFGSDLMCDAVDYSVSITSRRYLCGRYKGEFHTVVAKKCLMKRPFFKEFNGGEGIVWSRIAIDIKQVIFHPYQSVQYETSGSDRLSIRAKNYSRLAKVFGTDIRLLWKEYIVNCPMQLVIRVIKFIMYLLMRNMKG